MKNLIILIIVGLVLGACTGVQYTSQGRRIKDPNNQLIKVGFWNTG